MDKNDCGQKNRHKLGFHPVDRINGFLYSFAAFCHGHGSIGLESQPNVFKMEEGQKEEEDSGRNPSSGSKRR